jgi:hypothetical protein
MLESQEIDALLISALYGELTPAEETRLEAHLGSHPADKSALAALTSTRDAVRSSRILQVQLDPPQSVSALLLQEAARRAPKPQQQEGWFARLARSFMAHPAMAAAAMLVVVIGVATLVQNRKGDHFADTTAPSQSMEAKPSVADQTLQPGKDSSEKLDEGVAGGEAGSSAGSAAFGGDDGYRVSLADSDARDRKLEEKQQVVDAKVGGAERKKLEAPKQEPSAPQDVSGVGDETAAKGKKTAAVAKKPPSGTYMELRSPEPTVKELENNSNADAAQGQAYATVPTDDLSRESVNAVTPGPRLGATGSGNGTATTSTAAPGSSPRGNTSPPATKPTTKADPAKQSPKPAESQVARNVDSAPRNQQAPARNAPATTAPPPPPPAPPSKVAATTGAKTAAPAEDKDKGGANDPQLAWAREQHTAIIARVRTGDCKGAASIAVGLANRDLAYYRQNVASDRSVKECLAYIDNAREKDQEQRAERTKAAKRSSNEPSPAPKKAADQPAKATTDAAH